MRLNARQKLFVVLATVFTTCLVVGDIIGGKLIETQLFGVNFITTVGMIPFPVTFLLTDLLHEFYGKAATRFVTLVGFGMALLSFLFIYVGAAVPIASLARDPGWQGVTESAFANVFLGSQRMIAASLTAYLISQFVDIATFHLLKRLTSSRMLWLRATGSTAVSQLIDSVVISFAAFGGLMSSQKIVEMIRSGYMLKLIIAISLTPLIYIGHAVVERWLGIAPVVLNSAGEVQNPEQHH
jgi:uncharacterized integral membrane protein (TIGR00697 family)